MYTNKNEKKAINYFRRTFKNKLCAALLFMVGLIALGIDSDATSLVFISCIAVPLFFAKENWIY